MNLTITNNENPFDPTPKLKSSPVPILFIPFNNNESKCNYCKNKYSITILFNQKYCKNCLLQYIESIFFKSNPLVNEYIYISCEFMTNGI